MFVHAKYLQQETIRILTVDYFDYFFTKDISVFKPCICFVVIYKTVNIFAKFHESQQNKLTVLR